MAFTAKLLDKELEGTRITIIVAYTDSATGWSRVEHIPFARGDQLVIADIMAKVNEIGSRYKAALNRFTGLDQYIGNEVVI